MTRWEYKTVQIDTKPPFFTGRTVNTAGCTKLLNEYGAAGWELVTVFTALQPLAEETATVPVFKRPMK